MLDRVVRVAMVVWPLCLVAAGAGLTSSPRAAGPQRLPGDSQLPPASLGAPPALVVDAIVVDRKGAPVEDMRARDFDVTVDGRRRNGVAMARSYRGPGAAGVAALRPATMPGEVQPIVEPSRLVVVAIDQASFLPGDETRARLAGEKCVALFGLTESIAMIPLPLRRTAGTVSFERSEIRPALASLRPLRSTDAAVVEPQATERANPPDDPERVAETTGRNQARMEAAAQAGSRPPSIPTLEDLMPSADRGGREVLSPPAQRTHAVATLSALETIFKGLRAAPGSKTVLFLSAGLVGDEARSELRAAVDAAVEAHVRVSSIQVPTGASRFADLGRRDLQAIASETGGSFVSLSSRPEQALQRMVAELSSSYLLLLAPEPGDVDPGNSHTIQVKSTRGGVSIRTARSVRPGRLSVELLRAAIAPAIPPMAAPPPSDVPGPITPLRARPDPALNAVLARVSQYVVDYGNAVYSIVAEETYRQDVRGGPPNAPEAIGGAAQTASASARTRLLTSDYLLVKIPGLDGWLPFRDVFAVDGQPVRDRQDRLVKLFLEASPAAALDNMRLIFQESARYNIGNIERNINVPTLMLWFLEPGSQHRFLFSKSGEETLGGTRAWAIDYQEIGRPTFIKTPAKADVPASGRVWVEPVSGRILRTMMKVSMATITVTYGPRDELPGLWVPVMMEERYEYGSKTVTGLATYSKFRRFQVSTKEQIKILKRPRP